jgi:hypothetical protein
MLICFNNHTTTPQKKPMKTSFKTRHYLSLGLLCTGLCANIANAATLITINTGTNQVETTDDVSAGFQFTVGNNAIEITKLGYLIGLGVSETSTSTDVAIWRVSDQVEMTRLTVADTSPDVQDDFRWGTLGAPVTLAANTQYVIAANRGASEWLYNSFGGVTSGSGVTYDTAAVGGFGTGSGTQSALVYPDETGGIWPSRVGAFGGNAQYTVVPEPGAFPIAAGLTGLVVALGRRRRTN